MDKKSEAVAENLRVLRTRRKLSQSELARRLGVAQTTVSAWEHEGGIGFRQAVQLADFYGVSLDDLAGRRL